MNILFLLKNFGTGGLEIVSRTLADKFIDEGHSVSFFILHADDKRVLGRLDKRVRVYLREDYCINLDNIKALRRILIADSIQIIINQWGLPFIPVSIAKAASWGLEIKIISVHHNSPEANGKVLSIKQKLDGSKSAVSKWLLKLEYFLVYRITSASMRYVYRCSDLYMVLSSSFIEKFKSFTGIKRPDKLIVQINPLTIDTFGYSYAGKEKGKEIVYIGRLDNNQKKTHRIINVWSLLENKYPGWMLRMVGDGPERAELESETVKLDLHNVRFEGFRAPEPYYEKASILMLCSDFEGFPLVLAECMSFGVVPVVYGSYSAVHDIIRNGINGIIVEPMDGKFNAENMAKALADLIDDSKKLEDMAVQAILTSKQYSLDSIYESWNKLFNHLFEN